MVSHWSRNARLAYLGTMVIALLAAVGVALAVEVGQPAPDFRLAATTGGQISLSQFRGKQVVLIEFYSADFAPV